MTKRQRTIRPKLVPKGPLAPMERRTVKRVLSMKTMPAFKSQLEQEYRYSNLTAVVLSKLFRSVNYSRIRFRKKQAMLEAITYYYYKVR